MAELQLLDLTYSEAEIDAFLADKADKDEIRTAAEQDVIDTAQDAVISQKAESADVRTAAEQDVIDAAQDEAIAGKAPISMNMQSYFDITTATLYTTDNGNDPQP